MPELTQERVKEIFDYNPISGDLIRTKLIGSKSKLGPIRTLVLGRYYQVGIDAKKYYVHRIIWLWIFGYLPDEIDHLNHRGTDNRIVNLRDANHRENVTNQAMSKSNKSGVTGVHYRKDREMWEAYIKFKYVKKNLGLFKCKQDAITARKTAEKKYGFHPNHGKSHAEISN